MKRKTLKIALPLFVSLILVFAIYSWFSRSDSAQQSLAESVKQSELVFEQYFAADYATARNTMLNHIQYIDRLSAESAHSIRNPYAADAMCWYVRLGKLEERNNGSAKEEYLKEACSRCEKLGWADCSKDKLLESVDAMDKTALAQLNRK